MTWSFGFLIFDSHEYWSLLEYCLKNVLKLTLTRIDVIMRVWKKFSDPVYVFRFLSAWSLEVTSSIELFMNAQRSKKPLRSSKTFWMFELKVVSRRSDGLRWMKMKTRKFLGVHHHWLESLLAPQFYSILSFNVSCCCQGFWKDDLWSYLCSSKVVVIRTDDFLGTHLYFQCSVWTICRVRTVSSLFLLVWGVS